MYVIYILYKFFIRYNIFTMTNSSAEIIKKFKQECDKFPQDKRYRETLASCINIPTEQYYLLRPIIGENEFKNIVENLQEINFMPGEKKDLTVLDSHDDRYLKSGDFKANLHIHTVYSDGHITIDDFLNQAEELGNKNLSLSQCSSMPLVVAITDHDCIDGAKEMLLKVSKSPQKFQNVRIVLGMELSTITNKFKHLKKPLLIHTHMFCINPFDTKLNQLITQKSNLKKQLVDKTVQKINSELEKELNFDFNLEELGKIHAIILKGQDEVCIPMKKYTGAKILFNHYVLNNTETLSILNKNNIDINKLNFYYPLQYKKLFKRKGGFIKNYKEALTLYLNEFTSDEQFKEIIEKKDENTENLIKRAFKICTDAHPSLTDMPEAFFEFEQTLKILSEQDFGVFGIAHPARTLVWDVDSDLSSLFDNMFSSFKQYGKEKALFYEGFYQSYEGSAYLEYLEPINKNALKYGLLKTGGLDSHGPNIISRCPYC